MVPFYKWLQGKLAGQTAPDITEDEQLIVGPMGHDPRVVSYILGMSKAPPAVVGHASVPTSRAFWQGARLAVEGHCQDSGKDLDAFVAQSSARPAEQILELTATVALRRYCSLLD